VLHFGGSVAEIRRSKTRTSLTYSKRYISEFKCGYGTGRFRRIVAVTVLAEGRLPDGDRVSTQLNLRVNLSQRRLAIDRGQSQRIAQLVQRFFKAANAMAASSSVCNSGGDAQ